jgi:hypothetical protein
LTFADDGQEEEKPPAPDVQQFEICIDVFQKALEMVRTDLK